MAPKVQITSLARTGQPTLPVAFLMPMMDVDDAWRLGKLRYRLNQPVSVEMSFDDRQ